MQAQGIFNLSVAAPSESRRGDRIGLLRGRTGVPLFLLYLESLTAPQRWEMHTLEDVENAMAAFESAPDKKALAGLRSFFEAEGTRAIVAASPLSRSSSVIGSLMGQAPSLTQRSGINLTKDYVEVADLLSVPQAPELLTGDAYRAWLEAARGEVDALEQYFTLLDLPRSISRRDALNLVEGFHWKDAGFYYPALVQGTSVTSASPLVAALFQKNDRDYGIQEIPANRPLAGSYQPLHILTPFELREMQERRVNVLHQFGGGGTRIWGGRTASEPQDKDSDVISNRRTLLAVKNAVHEICERFVMEPLGVELPHEVELQISSSFQPIIQMFAGNDGARFDVKAETKTESGEDILSVSVTYSLPFALDAIHFDLGLTG